jgi:hypothetical protein
MDSRSGGCPMTQKDWQKDMEMCQGFLADSGWSRRDLIAEQPQMSMYWLQEAKEIQDIASGRGREVLRLRELLKGLNDELTASEGREQRLIEAIKKAQERFKHGNVIMALIEGSMILTDVLTTLYPDTPAPKEGATDNVD